ncbi:MAG: IS4 family transposase [Planctomycetota bacterium]
MLTGRSSARQCWQKCHWPRYPLSSACPVLVAATIFLWYSQRWKIETFHKILKSGCKAEDTKLRTAERLTNLIAVFCIVAWRVFWLTMVHRTNPKTPADAVFTETEIAILNHVAGDSPKKPPKTIARYLLVVAKLGGYLARKHDGPPGNIVMWRGLTRLTDIHFGVEIGREFG